MAAAAGRDPAGRGSAGAIRSAGRVQPAEQPGRAGRPGALEPQGVAQVAVVGDDQEPGGARSAPSIARVSSTSDSSTSSAVRAAAVPDRRSPAAIRSPRSPRSGGPSKTSSMAIGGRDDAPQPADQRRRGAAVTAPSRQRVEQVRAVDEQPVGAGRAGSQSGGLGHRAPSYAAGAAPRLRSGGEPAPARRSRRRRLPRRRPVPGVAAVLADRAARGDDVVYVTNNSMHYRADYVTRLAAMGAPVTAETVVSSARATALHIAEPRDRHPARARPRRRRPGARAARRRARRGDRRRTPRRGCTRRASMAGPRPAPRMRSSPVSTRT